MDYRQQFPMIAGPREQMPEWYGILQNIYGENPEVARTKWQYATNRYFTPEGGPTEDLQFVYDAAIKQMEETGYQPAQTQGPTDTEYRAPLLQRMREFIDRPYQKRVKRYEEQKPMY